MLPVEIYNGSEYYVCMNSLHKIHYSCFRIVYQVLQVRRYLCWLIINYSRLHTALFVCESGGRSQLETYTYEYLIGLFCKKIFNFFVV